MYLWCMNFSFFCKNVTAGLESWLKDYKNTWCYRGGPGFESQYPYSSSLPSTPVLKDPGLSSVLREHPASMWSHIYMQVKPYITKLKNASFLKISTDKTNIPICHSSLLVLCHPFLFNVVLWQSHTYFYYLYTILLLANAR